MNNDNEYCPKCGYPSNCFGIYFSGNPCGGCGYIDVPAKIQNIRKESEKDIRVKKLRENPPIFKSAEDWEKWNQE